MQKRIKSKLLWLSTVANIVDLALLVGALTAEKGQLIMLVAAILLKMLEQWGIVNNPTDPNKL